MAWRGRFEKAILGIEILVAGAILLGIAVAVVHVASSIFSSRNDDFTRTVHLDQGLDVLEEEFIALGERMDKLFGSRSVTCDATTTEQSGRLRCDFCSLEESYCFALLDCEFSWQGNPYQPACTFEQGGVLFTGCGEKPGTLFHCGYSDPTIRLVWCEPRSRFAYLAALSMRCFNRGGSLP